MKKKILIVINAILFLLFVASAISMILYKWGPASLAGHERTVWIHELSGILFFLCAVGHLILNWGWIRTTYLKRKKS